MALMKIKISEICVICVPFHPWWCAAAHEISWEKSWRLSAVN
jgi:hypothetical protein